MGRWATIQSIKHTCPRPNIERQPNGRRLNPILLQGPLIPISSPATLLPRLVRRYLP